MLRWMYRLEIVFLAVLVLCFLFYFAFTNVLGADEREHIYATFLVLKGYIPYRDFFEHHHPLLWYLFSPILALFLNDANVWYAARIFVLFILAIDCFFIGKICFLIRRDIEFALLSILFFLLPEVVVLEGVSFRPDGLMMCFVFPGFIFCFPFLKLEKNLIWCVHLFYSFWL